MKRFQSLLSSLLLAATLAAPAAAVDWHGFAEGGYGVRATDSDTFRERDFTLDEARVQLKLSAYGSAGEAFLRADLVHDGLDSRRDPLELREGFLRFTTLADHLDVKAGRQISTWGTGDLLFINDLFPKDWVSFFIGREDQYLKAPGDALRLGIFGLPADIEVIWSPQFTPDRTPTGSRLAFYSPPAATSAPVLPSRRFENSELAVRVARMVGNYSAALYAYRGFFKTPMGLTESGSPFHPELSVYGASLRGGAIGGVVWLEGGLYDSRGDRDGDNPLVPNGSLRYLAGHERQIATDLTAGVQAYGELMMDFDAFQDALPPGAPAADELRQLYTLRVEKMLLYQTLRLSAFVFWSPTDEDVYIRPFASYKLSDAVEVAAGANVFEGDTATTQFGQFDDNDNVYLRMRYSF